MHCFPSDLLCVKETEDFFVCLFVFSNGAQFLLRALHISLSRKKPSPGSSRYLSNFLLWVSTNVYMPLRCSHVSLCVFLCTAQLYCWVYTRLLISWVAQKFTYKVASFLLTLVIGVTFLTHSNLFKIQFSSQDTFSCKVSFSSD